MSDSLEMIKDPEEIKLILNFRSMSKEQQCGYMNFVKIIASQNHFLHGSSSNLEKRSTE